jgi:hypothetical protein
MSQVLPDFSIETPYCKAFTTTCLGALCVFMVLIIRWHYNICVELLDTSANVTLTQF